MLVQPWLSITKHMPTLTQSGASHEIVQQSNRKQTVQPSWFHWYSPYFAWKARPICHQDRKNLILSSGIFKWILKQTPNVQSVLNWTWYPENVKKNHVILYIKKLLAPDNVQIKISIKMVIDLTNILDKKCSLRTLETAFQSFKISK